MVLLMYTLTSLLLSLLSFGIANESMQNQLKDANFKVFANREVTYGHKTAVIVTLAKYPTFPIVLSLSTSKYLLFYQEVAKTSNAVPRRFSKTNNISDKLTLFQIVPSKPVTYESGFYVVMYATFWQFLADDLVLEATVKSQPQVKPLKLTYMVSIKKPSVCLPDLIVPRCYNPRQPLSVDTGRGVDLRADLVTLFNETCDVDNVGLSWTIMDLMENNLISFFNQSIRFTLRPYVLSFPTKYELWRNRYVILIEGHNNGVKFAGRCYLQTQQELVEAIIRGGQSRKVKYSSALTMDGSQSRDYSKPKPEPKHPEYNKQFRVYFWECQSDDDKHNPVCYRNMPKVSAFNIPRNSLRLGNKYTFTLRVVADDNQKIMDTAHQTVEVVDVDCLEVAIICQANCDHNRYNAKNMIMVKAECYNCEKLRPRYSWYVNNVLTNNKQKLVANPNAILTEIRLVIKTMDGREGTETKLLSPYLPPRFGKCEIKPTHGMEAHTRFYVCCQNFSTRHEPLEYYYYADRVLLNVCRDCNCASHLPLHLRFVKVLICDIKIACVTRYVQVNVSPLANITMDTPQKLWELITTPPRDIVGQAVKERTLRLMAYIQSLANRIRSEPNKAMVLMRAYQNVHRETLAALGKLANLTQTLSVQLSPIDPDEEGVLILSLSKLNEIFQAVINNQISDMLAEEPYINVTVSCITVFSIMAHINKQLPRPPQAIYKKYMHEFKSKTLEQPVIDQLLYDINNYSNEGVRRRSFIWLNSTWETERLYRFLQFARDLGIQEDESDFNAIGVSFRNTCFDIETGRTYTIDSTDHMHTVYFSPELLQETKETGNNTICIKVISNIRELNWWFPDNRQPSTVLLTVHIYTGEDNFKEERKLEYSKIIHKTVIGKYKPAREDQNFTMDQQRYLRITNFDQNKNLDDNYDDEDSVADTGKFISCLKHGTIDTMQDLRVYRINLDEQSMLAVRFQHTTHRLRALLIMNKLPKQIGRSITKSGCVVPANSRNTTMLMRNNCMKWHRVYLALQIDADGSNDNITVPKGPAKYSFIFEVRSCDYWMYSLGGDKQRWSHDFCLPGLEFPRRDSIECTCIVLGTYTSYVFHAPAITVPTNENVPVSINWWYMIMFFLVLFLLLLWIVALFVWYNKPHFKTIRCDMTGLEDKSDREVHDLLVYLKTGGRINALTTATVRITFETQQQKELHFMLMQDPEHPELTRNSTYVLWLRTRDIRIPTRVAISHDNSGRYPSWFLRRIELVDLQEQLTQVFDVHRWVRHKLLILSSTFVRHLGDRQEVQSWRQRFTTEFERLWINWGLWHPLTGMWRESAFNDSMTRAQRASIFITKMIVVYCVCACYLGPTTPETAFADRKNIIEYPDLIKMFLISFVFTNLVHFLLESCILKKEK